MLRGVSLAIAAGEAVTSWGTSGTVLAPTHEPRVDPTLRAHTFCHVAPGTWYLMGVVLSAGGAFAWYRDHLQVGAGCAAPGSGEADGFSWRTLGGPVVFAPFAASSDYFAADKAFMLNLRVSDLAGMIETLGAAGIAVERQVVGTVELPEIRVGGALFRNAHTKNVSDPNLIVRFGTGSGPALLFMAHYDTVHGSPGAIDNAVGVAVLLELARVLQVEAPPQPVMIVFTAASMALFVAYYARHPRVKSGELTTALPPGRRVARAIDEDAAD